MIDFKDLLKAGVHFGHKTSFWNAKMRPYIWGSKNRVHLIDISKTAFLLEHTGKQLKEIAANGGSILWVGTKKAAQEPITKAAKSLNMPYVINRWIGGTLTNYTQIKKAITRYLHLQDIIKKSDSHYTKKEKVMLQKQLDRLERNIGGIVDLAYPPAAVVIVDAKREHSALKEANGIKVPVAAIVDTNTDPEGINFIIPANDDSPKSISFIISYLVDCVAEGQKLAKDKKEKAKAAILAEKAKKIATKKDTSPVKKATEISKPKSITKKIITKPPVKKVAETKKTVTKKVIETKPVKKTVVKETVKKIEKKAVAKK